MSRTTSTGINSRRLLRRRSPPRSSTSGGLAGHVGDLLRGLSPGGPEPLRRALSAVVRQDGPRPAEVPPITHAVVPDVGAVAAFHVSESAWLLAFFPSAAPSFPGRRHRAARRRPGHPAGGLRSEPAQGGARSERAARALGEKQNLLNTMQVPLIVVDPNTDEMVSANRSRNRSASGGGRGSQSAIAPDAAGARALRAHRRSQPAKPAAPTACRSASKPPAAPAHEQFASSDRSPSPLQSRRWPPTNGTASPSSFSIDPQSDLRLLLDDVRSAAHTDERRRLAGLLSHGLDSLADVLRRRRVGRGQTGGQTTV